MIWFSTTPNFHDSHSHATIAITDASNRMSAPSADMYTAIFPAAERFKRRLQTRRNVYSQRLRRLTRLTDRNVIRYK